MAWTERYVDAAAAGGGDGTTSATSGANGAWTLAEAIANYAAGQRVNIKAGTYTNTTTDRTFATNGTTTSPVWIRGYKTTIGDMDDAASHGTFASGTEIPAITFTTGRLSFTGNHLIVSNLDVQGAQTTTGQLRTFTGANMRFIRLRVECTASNASGRAAALDAGNTAYEQCWFKATSTANDVVLCGASASACFAACAFEGGGDGLEFNAAVGAGVVYHCVFNNVGGDSVKMSAAGRFFVLGCTSYSPGSDGIKLATTVPVFAAFYDNLFSESAGYSINNSTGTNTNVAARSANLSHSPTSGNESGFGDSPALNAKSDSSSPFTNAGSGDLSLVSASNAKGNGLPGAFENQSYTSYLDIGAVQRQEAGGSGGGYIAPGRTRLVPVRIQQPRMRPRIVPGPAAPLPVRTLTVQPRLAVLSRPRAVPVPGAAVLLPPRPARVVLRTVRAARPPVFVAGGGAVVTTNLIIPRRNIVR